MSCKDDGMCKTAVVCFLSECQAEATTASTIEGEQWSVDEIADACVKAGLGVFECNALIVALKGNSRAAEPSQSASASGAQLDTPLMRVHLEHLRHCAPSDLPFATATFLEFLAGEVGRAPAPSREDSSAGTVAINEEFIGLMEQFHSAVRGGNQAAADRVFAALVDFIDSCAPAPGREAKLLEAIRTLRIALAEAGIKPQWAESIALRALVSTNEFATAPLAVSQPPAGKEGAEQVAQSGATAPWPDFRNQPIRHGDRLVHPDGNTFIAVRLQGYADEGDAWRAVYDYDPQHVSRLGLQIGDKGRAVLVQHAALAAGKEG